MEIKLTGNSQLRKLAALILEASRIGMDLSGYGDAAENPSSGNVYIWLEDYPYCLYIGLGSDTIYALWSDPDTGEEHIIETAGKSMSDLNAWVESLQATTEEF